MQPILDITTLIERPAIRIDGVVYELYARKELPIVATERLRLLYEKIRVAEAIKKPTKAQQADYVKLLRQFVGVVAVNLPPRVLGRLVRADLVAIIKAFFHTPQTTPATRKGHQTAPTAKARRSTGAR